MSALPAVDEITYDPGFSELKRYVITLTGLAYFASREGDLAARLRRRMIATGAHRCAEYLSLLRGDRSREQDALIHELTIGETHFFRFSEQFEALREVVLPELIRKNRQRRQLRFWSAGCSIGPEVYSLAILLDRSFGAELRDWSISILGTDLDTEYLERARNGVYAEWALRGLSSTLRAEYFKETETGWQVDPRCRRWVTFARHNLAQDPLPAPRLGLSDLDLILCRNVMIYFDAPTIDRIVAGLQRSLSPEGWLLVGHAEGNANAFSNFRVHQSKGAVLFQNASDGTSLPYSERYLPPALRGDTRSEVQQPSSTSPVELLQGWRPYSWEAPPAVTSTPPCIPVDDAADDPLGMIRASVDRGEWRVAEEQVRRLREAQPLSALVYYYEGLVLAHTAALSEAEAALRRALFLDPELPLAYYQLGLLLSGRGARAEAQRAFRNTLRVLEQAPADAPVSGSELTVARLREAATLQLRGVER